MLRVTVSMVTVLSELELSDETASPASTGPLKLTVAHEPMSTDQFTPSLEV